MSFSRRSRFIPLALLLAVVISVTADDINEERAEALIRAHKWAQAEEMYTQLLPTLAGDAKANAYNRIGYALERNRNQLDAAVAAHRNAMEVEGATDQTKAYAWLRIGYCLKAQRKFDEATVAFAHIEALDDVSATLRAEALLYKAWGQNSGGDPDAARASMKQVTQLEGASGHLQMTAWMTIGRLAEKKGDYAEAMKAFQHIVDGRGTKRQKEEAKGYIAEITMLMKGDVPFYIYPYVTKPTATGAKISWVSQGKVTAGTVTVKGTEITVNASLKPMKSTTCNRQIADITGLKPGTVYHYQVSCGGETMEGSFKTVPPHGTPITIGVLGDTQAEPETHRAVAGAIAADGADLVLHVGDLTDYGASWGRWRSELFEPAWAYMQESIFVPAVGNHDGGPYYPALFDAHPDYYHAVDYGDVCVAVLDSYWGGQSKNGRPDQLAWLEQVLTETEARWKIVSLHVPMVAAKNGVAWFGYDDFLPLLEKLEVDLVVCGHHPMYRRFLPIGEPGNKPVLHVTSGGGGPVGDPVPSPLMVVGAGLSHHSHITIDGNRLDLVAKQPDGTVLDRFSLTKSNGVFQDEVMSQAIGRVPAHKIKHVYQELLTVFGNDLLLGLEEAPVPGKPTTFLLEMNKLKRGGLKLDQLPKDTTLIVSQAPGCAWKVEEQVIPLTASTLAIRVQAPDDFHVGTGVFNPPLQLTLNVGIGERRLVPIIVRARLHEQAQAMLDGKGSALPSIWDFRLDPDDVGRRDGWATSAAKGEWKKLAVTSWWERLGYEEFDGVAWYRATFTAPEIKPGHRLWVEFGAIDESCEVFLNGISVGNQVFDTTVDDLAWEKPRRFDLTDALTVGGNLLVVRVQDTFGMGGIYRGAVLTQRPVNYAAQAVLGATPDRWEVRQGGKAITRPATLLVGTDTAMYVDEPSLRLDHRVAGPLSLHAELLKALPAGTWSVSLRYRTTGVNGKAGTVEIGGVELPLPSTKGKEWQQATGTFTQAADGSVQCEIALDKSCTLWLTALEISAKE